MDEQPTAPPFRRQARNLWVMAQRGARLPGDAVRAERVVKALDQVIRVFQHVSLLQGAQLRLLTGIGDDIDTRSAEIAKKYDCPWDVVAPCWPGGDMQPERTALILEEPAASPDSAVAAAAAADEAKLGYADAAVVVCDGAPLSDYAAQRDHILLEALCRHLPIVWIDTRAEAAGATWILPPQSLDELAVSTLGKDPEQVRRIAGYFSRVKPADLAAELAELLAIYWNADATMAIDALLQRPDGDPGQHGTLHGMYYTAFLSAFGNWKIKLFSPVEAQRGPPKFVEASQFPADTWAWYDRIDRTATYAAYCHRDQVVVVNLAASFAVFAAVAGEVPGFGTFWSKVELLLLALIGYLVYGNRHRPVTHHDRWLHFRQSAEALRLSAVLHPLLANLPLLHRSVWKYDGFGAQPVLDKPFHWLVIQLLRDAGIPGGSRPHCIETRFHDLADSLDALIRDQETYHERNRRRYEHTHHRLRTIIAGMFWAVFLWVGFNLAAGDCDVPPEVLRPVCAVKHMAHELHLALFLTAFLPALAAAMHGIASKAELQRLAKNSDRMHRQLAMLRRPLESVRRRRDPMALRALAIQAAETMYAEHDAWAELMADQPLELV